MDVHQELLRPVVALAAWTMVMWAWMYATRLPAMRAARMKPDPDAPRGEQMATLPPRVRWKADNYNHLMEQPTVFYPVATVLALVSTDAGTDAALAWAYVALRVVHSIFQAVVNKIEVRFGLFVLSSLALVAMIARAVLSLA
ncbi:MAG: MAPEG family protein [Sandaracinaceae bacterium]|nr:MAPEG family protein [Sandaracinaceae bacterium]